MANTVQIVKMKLAQAEFYVDEWPQFTSIAGRIVSPTVSNRGIFIKHYNVTLLSIYILAV